MTVEIKKLIEDLGKEVHGFKAENDARLKAIESKGHADPLLAKKVDEIGEAMLKAAEAKDAAEKEARDRIEKLEAKLNKAPGMEGRSESEEKSEMDSREYKAAYVKGLRKGYDYLSPEERKALSVGGDPQGGYLVRPEQSSQIIKKVFETSPMREVATVETIGVMELEIMDDTDEADAGWTGETASRTDTDEPDLAMRKIVVHEIYAKPKASQTLLDDANMDVESWLSQKVAAKFSRMENTAFITGNGVTRPRGIMSYAAATSNNVANAERKVYQRATAGSNVIAADDIKTLYYDLKAPYLPGAVWLMPRLIELEVSKLKATTGNYLWQPGLQPGQPRTVLGQPLHRMEDIVATMADNTLAAAFGDFKQGYTIVDRMGIRVLRDPYSSKPYIEFYSTKRVGGDVTNFEAFNILKITA